jgi:hypothetical protein
MVVSSGVDANKNLKRVSKVYTLTEKNEYPGKAERT